MNKCVYDMFVLRVACTMHHGICSFVCLFVFCCSCTAHIPMDTFFAWQLVRIPSYVFACATFEYMALGFSVLCCAELMVRHSLKTISNM